MFGEEDVVRSHQKRRAKFIFFIVFFSFLLIVSRLWYLQILNGEMLIIILLKIRLEVKSFMPPEG